MKMSPESVLFQRRTAIAIGTAAVAPEQTIKIHILHRRELVSSAPTERIGLFEFE